MSVYVLCLLLKSYRLAHHLGLSSECECLNPSFLFRPSCKIFFILPFPHWHTLPPCLFFPLPSQPFFRLHNSPEPPASCRTWWRCQWRRFFRPASGSCPSTTTTGRPIRYSWSSVVVLEVESAPSGATNGGTASWDGASVSQVIAASTARKVIFGPSVHLRPGIFDIGV